jgi:hypothetical protein
MGDLIMKFELSTPPNFLKVKNMSTMIDIGGLEQEEFDDWLIEYNDLLIQHYNKRKNQLRDSQIL